eukprot:g26772.t1
MANLAKLQAEDAKSARSEAEPLSARSAFSVQTCVLEEHRTAVGASSPSGREGFATEMVRGREVDVPDANGTLTPQICKLSKKVDALVVGPQAVQLVEIAHLHRGMEALPLSLNFELTPNWIVLELEKSAGDLLSLRLTSAETAETFALFLRLLVSMRRQHARVKDVKPKECRTLKKGQESRWVEHVGGK